MFPNFSESATFSCRPTGCWWRCAFLAACGWSGRLSRRAGLDDGRRAEPRHLYRDRGDAGREAVDALLDFDYYARNPGEIFSLATLQAGGVFYGGLIGGAGDGVSLHAPQQAARPGDGGRVRAGHRAGARHRPVGCFAAGCCWGAPCQLPWAVTFTESRSAPALGVPLDVPLHPTQLYEAVAEAIIFAILYRRFRRPHRPGAIIGLYLVLYPDGAVSGGVRPRARRAESVLGPFVAEQWIALGLIALGVYLIRGAGRTPAPAAAKSPARARR